MLNAARKWHSFLAFDAMQLRIAHATGSMLSLSVVIDHFGLSLIRSSLQRRLWRFSLPEYATMITSCRSLYR